MVRFAAPCLPRPVSVEFGNAAFIVSWFGSVLCTFAHDVHVPKQALDWNEFEGYFPEKPLSSLLPFKHPLEFKLVCFLLCFLSM